MTSIGDIIVYTAKEFIGQREISGNLGFKDEEFQELMEATGWEKGQAWCAYFAELVWKEAYKQYDISIIPQLDTLFSAGAVATYNNFRRSHIFEMSKIPTEGALIVWQSYKEKEGVIRPHWSGHIGIVESYYKDVIKTIEGNTNSSGGREGIEVAEKMRDLDFTVKKGLVLKGFVYPV